MAERWLHTFWFSGPSSEDRRYDAVIDGAADSGFKFEGGYSAPEDVFEYESEKIEQLEYQLDEAYARAVSDVVEELRAQLWHGEGPDFARYIEEKWAADRKAGT